MARDTSYRGIVYPTGDSPDNGSWTGFQSHIEDENRGHLTVFRERCNTSPSHEMKLRYAANRRLAITDLMSRQAREVTAGSDGDVVFTIESAPGYAFCSYELA